MGSDQITGILRVILSAAGGYVTGKGLISGDMWNWIAGGALTLGPAVWSWFTNRPASLAAKVKSIPGVDVVASPAAPADVKAALRAG